MKKILLFAFSFLSIFTYAQTALWGVTSAGGHFNGGTIFKTDGSGKNYSLKKSMFQYAGEYAKSSLLQASNGKIYGMTSSCCVFGAYGIFFQYDPVTKEYDKLIDFNDTINGSDPEGGLIQGSDGKLYGMTCKGGVGNWGVIFQYDPASAVFKKLHDFDDKNGSYPQGNLVQAADGMFYGLTNTGGANDFGVLFQFDPVTSTYTKKIDFTGELNGNNPLGSLIQTKNGKLYGLTSGGGKSGYGSLFEFDPVSSTLTKKFEFAAKNGNRPYGSLVEAPDGNLYGLTAAGGSNDFGVLFRFNISSEKYEVKIEFNDKGNGAGPKSTLTLATNGKLYGTTELGGDFGEGVIFEYDPLTAVLTKKFEFNNKEKSTGNYPIGPLMQSSDGVFYGMSYTGGTKGVGVLYTYNPSTSTFNKEFDFHASSNGSTPVSSMIYGLNRKLYGITQSGGIKNAGTIFQYDVEFDVYKKMFDFDGKVSGGTPMGALLQAKDGKIYGTTYEGGAANKGVLFQFDPLTNDYIVKVDFDGTNGSSPFGELMQANNGKIYGMTREGGATNNGVLFQFDPAKSIYTKKFDFDGAANGKFPEGGLTPGADGKLYGVTTNGGNISTPDFPDGFGVLFQFDPMTDKYIKKVDFDGSSIGGHPNGTLVKNAKGRLYGMTTHGGKKDPEHPAGHGVLFQFDPITSSASGMLNFNGVEKGSNPNGSLLLASDGNFYGVTNTGGIFNMGVLFQIDPVAFTFNKTWDFAQPTGKLADHAKLLEVETANAISENQDLQMTMSIFPNPGKELVSICLDQLVYNATLKVMTLSGQCVMEKTKLSGTVFELNLTEFSSGIYFVELQENGNTSRMKLIKD